MSQSEQSTLTTPTLSITNFDLPSLHLLHNEITVTLKNAENHLRDFNDNLSQASLLLESIDDLTQLSRIFALISLKGGELLSLAIAQGLQQLYDTDDNTNAALIMDLSEAVMTLDRYIEFVLLTETIEPTLLLDIINKLSSHNKNQLIDATYFSDFGSNSIIIANPELNFESLESLGLDSELMTNLYRSGLAVLLVNSDGKLGMHDAQKVKAMSAVCELIASHSDRLFWQAANAAVTDIEALLPLSLNQKHALIYLEQQFNSYLPVMDIRFADLVSFACKRDNKPAIELRKQYALNQLELPQREQMKRFLFGPNRAITDIINALIQDKISGVKEKVASYARLYSASTVSSTHAEQITDIATMMTELGSTLQLLGLVDTATSLKNAAEAVLQWHQPSSSDFDHLLSALMQAENASIAIAKMHTPGVIPLSINNQRISAHQIDTAYGTLVQESRASIKIAEQAIGTYLEDRNHDLLTLQELPEMIRQVAGALRFLQLSAVASMFSQLANYIKQRLLSQQTIDEITFAHIADVMMAVDYRLEGFENNQPTNKRSLDIGQHSLNRLLAS